MTYNLKWKEVRLIACYFCMHVLIAIPTVLHLWLLSLLLLQKQKKIFSNSSLSQVAIYPKLGKTDSARVYMRAAILDASSWIRSGGRV
jgi:hypothetical protein